MRRPRSKAKVVFLGLLLAVVVVVAVVFIAEYMKPRTDVRIGDGVYRARIVRSGAELAKGLSGTTELGAGQAMLFVFPEQKIWSIWMKDMQYPIDVVWFNNKKIVVHIVKNMSPESYPESFTPDKPARYVLELPAGSVESRRIQIDQKAVFDETGGGAL